MSWPELALDQLGTVGRGKSRHRPRDAAHLYGGPYPFIQTGDVKHAGLYLADFSQTYNEAGLGQSKLWPEGTLCITIAANIADTSILKIEACFPDSIIGFIPNPEKADARFIKYLFDAQFKRQYQTFTQGAAQDNLSQGKLLSLNFPAPELSEQQRIADILSAYDDLIENNRRRIGLLEEAARQLYKEWFVRFRFPGHEHVKIVDGVPEGWEDLTYGDVFEFLGGFAFKSSTYVDEGKYGIVTIKNVHDGRFVPDCSSRVADIPQKMNAHCELKTGDILLSLTGNVGRACVVYGENLLLNQRVAKIVGRVEIPDSFTYWTFSNPETQRELENLAFGVAQLNLSPVKLAARPFVRPPRILLESFTDFADGLFKQIIKLNQSVAELVKARDLILPRLMNGSLTV